MAKAYKVADWNFNESKKCFVSWQFCMGCRLLHNNFLVIIYYAIPYHYILYHAIIYYRISSITSRGYYKFQLMPALGYYSRETTIRGRPLFFPQQFNIQPNPFSCPAHELAIIRSACFSVEEKIRRTQESKIENRHGRLRD